MLSRAQSPRWLLLLLMSLVAGWAQALAAGNWANEPDPHRLVEMTTDKVMGVIHEAQGYYEQDPDRFYTQIEAVLGQVVDFDSFARGVMGRYASRQRYQALTSDADRAEFRQRVERFSETFRRGLVETYAKGLLAFNGQKIEVVPPRSGEVRDRAARVMQRIYGDSAKPYSVQYSLRRDQEGHWKLRNVIIEGVNIGATYRNQFAAAVEQYGSVDAAIDHWQVEPNLEGQTAGDGSDDASED